MLSLMGFMYSYSDDLVSPATATEVKKTMESYSISDYLGSSLFSICIIAGFLVVPIFLIWYIDRHNMFFTRKILSFLTFGKLDSVNISWKKMIIFLCITYMCIVLIITGALTKVIALVIKFIFVDANKYF